MAAGAGFGTIIPLAMTLVGLVSILRARRARGKDPSEPDAEARRAAAAEMERRLAFYLAGRDSDQGPSGPSDKNG